jgi:murein DD-endopeptidase MepM/ murein hydrolase activator NlpD
LSEKLPETVAPQAGAVTPSDSGTSREASTNTKGDQLILLGTWLIAVSVVVLAVFVGWQTRAHAAAVETPEPTATPIIENTPEVQNTSAEMPVLSDETSFLAIGRRTTLHTIIPTRPRSEAISYTVGIGDSFFAIAKKFNITPETLWWANSTELDNPDAINPGLVLRVPPVNGVYYQWKENDTLEEVAARYKANVEDIINFLGNKLDLTNPRIQPGQWVMIQNGKGEFKQWVVPTIPRGKAGVSKTALGPGACEGGYDGAYGSGSFIWPTGNHTLSGNDYWSGHLGIDIGVGIGDSILASDSGVIVFAGGAYGGYGNMIMIDHGNGYQTLYAHLNSVSVRCGQSVGKGQYIGVGGTSGNSTGPHLHFEVRFNGGWINPWYVLPPP